MSWEAYNPPWHVLKEKDGHPQVGVMQFFLLSMPHEKLHKSIPLVMIFLLTGKPWRILYVQTTFSYL